MFLINNEIFDLSRDSNLDERERKSRYTAKMEGPQLVSDIMQLHDCMTSAEVNQALFDISQKLDFDGFLYHGRFHLGGTRYVEETESNYQAAWRQQYELRSYAKIDPTVSHALTSVSPLVWSDAMYTSEVLNEYKEDARQHGLGEGMTMPVHGRNGDVALLSLSTSSFDDEARRHVRGMLMWGSLLATTTHEAMRRIVKDQRQAAAPKLTRREAEVLQWIAGGKSNWEISRLIGISEHGISHHVRNILLKFDVASRHQAVAKAVAFGLL